MKIGILTYYGVHNYGALLQANALKTVLNSLGHECSFLTFSRNYDMIPPEQTKKYKLGLSSVPFYFKYLLDKGMGNLVFNYKKARSAKRYRLKNIPLDMRYSDYTGDAAVIGSDEVFSLEIGINPFFYGHGVRCPKVITYAGCFGPTTVEDIDRLKLRALVASGFQSIDSVSVRDKNSKDIVEALSGKAATLVCDPVILYGYKEEMLSSRPKMGDYVVVYAYDRNMNAPEEISAVRAFAKAHNCKIVSVGNYHKWCDRNEAADPIGMITWIKNAKYVITDTFHGSVVSIICNTPMIVKLRGNSNKLQFLLSEYGLTDRIVSNICDIDKVAENEIDFSAINEIISEKRELSLQYLKNVLGSAYDKTV